MMISPYLLMPRAKLSHAQRSELDGFERVVNDGSVPISCFGLIGDLNVFCGPNNAGKSRIMRQLFTRSSFVFRDGDQANDVLERLLDLQRNLSSQKSSINPQAEPLRQQLELLFEDPSTAFAAQKQQLIIKTQHGLEINPKAVPVLTREYLLSDPQLAIPFQQLRQTTLAFVDSSQIHRAFVPTLRSTVRIGDSLDIAGLNEGGGFDMDTDPLAVSFVDSYGLGRGRYHLQPSNHTIFTGARLYEIVGMQKGEDLEIRRIFERFEEFLGIEFFDGRRVRLVPRNRAQKRHDITGNFSPHVILELEAGDESWPIQDLGDGVSALLTLLVPIFLQREGSWIFIEEPENCLHPGLQRRFLEIAMEHGVRERKHRLFITTHSSHVLEAAREASGSRLFRVEKRETKLEEGEGPRKHFVTEVPRDTLELLDDLGVSAASVLQARCAIWVEGPSDVKYLRALIRLHSAFNSRSQAGATEAQLLEGRDYVFLVYGGSVLASVESDTEGAALHKLLPRIRSVAVRSIVIADRDGSNKEAKHRERRATYASAKVQYLTTTSVEMENELGLDVWKKLWPKICADWATTIPLKVPARKFRTQRIGRLTDHIFHSSRQAKSGTLSGTDKAKAANVFSELARDQELQWKDIGKDAKELTTKVLQFIWSAVPKRPAL